MRPPSSSKNSKKISDDDRSKKKKIKSRSAKRRRDSLISSYSSSSSQSESDSRYRRKSSKSKKLEKRRKQSKSKKSEKRKSRKKRYCSDSSFSSYSDSGDSRRRCPTCSDSERSRSPIRKKPKTRKRDRKSSQLSESKSKSKRSRYRSPSCSTCSSGGRSRSRDIGLRSPSPNPIEEKFDASRGHSPIGERFDGGGGQSPIDERFDGGRGRSSIEDRFGGSCGHSSIGERFDGGRDQSPIEERYRYKDDGDTKRLRSVLAVTKPSDVDGDKIIKAYDDYPSSRSNKVYDEGNTKRPGEASLVCEAELPRDSLKEKESEVDGGNGGKETNDLELILRQKALENFKKFRGGRNRDFVSDEKVEALKSESHEASQNLVKALECKDSSSPDDPKLVKGGALPNELKTSMSMEKKDGSGSVKPVASAITRRIMSNDLKKVHKISSELSIEKTSLLNDNQDRMAIAQPGSGSAIRAEVSTSDMSASVGLNTDNQNCKPNEPTGASASGSQFEQKTFSRVCDGETVQVSYKVYIPKKAATLARRQLQR